MSNSGSQGEALETPPCADIHLHVVGELARKLGQFAVDIAVLAGFDRTA